MEKTKEASVIEMKANWNDLGSWSSLHKASKKDKNGNSINGDVILNDVSNSLFYSDDRLIAAFGIDDLAVVSTKDALLIANKENDQDVKKMQDILKEMNRSEWEFHKEVHRPWGKYESIAEGKNFQVKIITVPANKKLSVQMHYKRSEHWTIVSGVASVTIGEKTFDLLQNQSCYIPVETIHALENKSSEELILIEVQCGSYLGEDDIVRFEDRYGRT
jgi:mannose-1-phosphate guanylyltransferase